MKTVRETVKKLVKYLGYDVKKRRLWCSFDSAYQIILDKVQQPVIFDVGANRGQSIERFRKIFPNSTIHSFEPAKESFKLLSKQFCNKKNIFLNNFGLGDKNKKITLHSYAHSGLTSFYRLNVESKITEWLWKKWEKEHDKNIPDFLIDSYMAGIKTLDWYIQKHQIDRISLLKIDTQGFEDKVLLGGKDALRKNIIDIIEMEILFDKMYERKLSFFEIEKILIPFGYELFGVDEAFNRFDRLNFQLDVTYISKRISEKFENFRLPEVPGYQNNK